MPKFGLGPVPEKTTLIILSGFPEDFPALLLTLLRLCEMIILVVNNGKDLIPSCL
jgi:hypothetical protein